MSKFAMLCHEDRAADLIPSLRTKPEPGLVKLRLNAGRVPIAVSAHFLTRQIGSRRLPQCRRL